MDTRPSCQDCHCSTSSRPSVHGAKSGWAHVAAALAGGLLGSSCCIVQLAMNALSLGCAGFSVFTPYQPYLRAATFAVIGHMLLRRGLNRRTAATAVLALTLAFSNDLLAWHNRVAPAGRFMPARAPLVDDATTQPPDTQPAAGADTQPQQDQLTAGKDAPAGSDAAPGSPAARYLRFAVAGIKCEGCAAKLKAAVMSRAHGTTHCSVNYASGQVLVWGSHELQEADVRSVIQLSDLAYRITLVEQTEL